MACNTVTLPTGAGEVPVSVCSSQDSLNVYGTIEVGSMGIGWGGEFWCKQFLERYEGGAWKIIASTSLTYVATGKNFNKQFSNIAKKGASTRVRGAIWANSSGTNFLRNIMSPTFKR